MVSVIILNLTQFGIRSVKPHTFLLNNQGLNFIKYYINSSTNNKRSWMSIRRHIIRHDSFKDDIEEDCWIKSQPTEKVLFLTIWWLYQTDTGMGLK